MKADRAVAVVQARMGSSRLPGKVLRPLAGRPVILHVVDRLRRVRGLDAIVIATTASAEDLPLVTLLRAEGVDVYAHPGDPNDLLGRYICAGRLHHADIVLMVCSDCPLFDPGTASRMVERLRDSPESEYVRIDPPGIEGGVACLRLSTYERIDREGATGPYREHATLRIIEHPERFPIVDVSCDPEYSDPADAHRFWLDTEADLRFLETVYERLWVPGGIVDLREVVRLLRAQPELRAINAHVQQKNPLEGRGGSSIVVALVATRGDPFCEAVAARLAEVHHVGVQWQGGPEPRDALDPRVRLLVVSRGQSVDPGCRCDLEVIEVDPASPAEQAADEICEALRARGSS